MTEEAKRDPSAAEPIGGATAPVPTNQTNEQPDASVPPPEKAGRRLAPQAVRADAPIGPITKLALALLWPIGFVLRPFGFFFRIREPLPVVLRVALPLLFMVGLIAVWSSATHGQVFLTRLPRLSPLDERKAEIEHELGTKVDLTTREKIETSWSSSEKKVRSEIVAVTLPRATFDEKGDEVAKLLGADQFDVDSATRAGPNVKLVARSHFGRFDGQSEYTKSRLKLETAIPGIKLETRDEQEGAGDRERPVTTLLRATAPEAAATSTNAKIALDDVVGTEAWSVVKDPTGPDFVIEGVERIETRKIGPALLPAPLEMVNSLPSLLNGRWATWQDAKHWWQVGDSERSPGAPPALKKKLGKLDWSKPNDVPFTLVSWVFERWIGPNWKDWGLLQAVAWSTIRIFMGFFYAMIAAVPLGVLMGSFSKPRSLFEPLRLMGSYLPLPAMATLTIIWWGTSETQKIAFLAVCSFVVLLPQVLMAVESIPQAHIDAARTLGATRWQQMRYVLLAGSKAEIMRSLRLTFAVGWTWIIFAETINPEAGLGYVIQLGERRPAHRPHIYAVVLLIILLAFLVNTTWAWVERKLYPYRDEA